MSDWTIADEQFGKQVVTSTISADIDSSLDLYCRCGRKAIEGGRVPDGSTDYVCKRGHGWVANIRLDNQTTTR